MERLALISIVFLSGLWAINGAMATAQVAGRKGYDPRLGALIGALVGFAGSLAAGLIGRMNWPDQGGIAVLIALIAGRLALGLLWHYVPVRDGIQPTDLPAGEALRRSIVARHVRGQIARGLYVSAVVIALVALATLLATIINKTFGLTAVQYAVEPQALTLAAYDPGASLGEVDPAQLPAVLAQNVRTVRLQELILERMAEADPTAWDALKALPLAEVLGGQPVPEALASVPVGALSADQAAQVLAGALDADALQELVYTEAGRPLTLFTRAELAEVLAETFSADDLRTLALTHVVGLDDEASIPESTVWQVIKPVDFPDAVGETPFSVLSGADTADILVRNLDRATLEALVIGDARSALVRDEYTLVRVMRPLDDLSAEELATVLAANVEAERMKTLVLAVAEIGAETRALAETQALGLVLEGLVYPEVLGLMPFGQLDPAQAADILMQNLALNDLRALVAAEVGEPLYEVGRPLQDLPADDLAEILMQEVRATRLRAILLVQAAVPRETWSQVNTQPVGAVLDGWEVPEALAAIPLNQLDAAQAVQILRANRDRATLQTLVQAEAPARLTDELPESALAIVLAENVSIVRLHELIVSEVLLAENPSWPRLVLEPALSAEQATDILVRNLDRDVLEALVLRETTPALLAKRTDAQLGALLAAAVRKDHLQEYVLMYVVQADPDSRSFTDAPAWRVLKGDAFPDAIGTLPFAALDAAALAEILLRNLPREAVADVLIFEADHRELDAVPRRALGAMLANTVNKNRLRKLIAIDIVGATESDLPALSSQPIGELLQGKSYPEALEDVSFSKLTTAQAADLLERNLSREALEKLIADEVVQQQVIKGWPLVQSLTERETINAYVDENLPRAHLQWFSWVNRNFLGNSINYSQPDATGVRPALIGSLLVILITIVIAFPIGVGAAIYLEEYAGRSRLNQLIQTNINNLAGVPSIIYGMLGLAIFVRTLGHFTSGNAFGVPGANGRTVFSAGLTLALLILPVIIINAQEAIRAVPGSLRQASYGLGATKWQTIWNHVLPYAMPGILTGTILAISRAIGETAPLILVGGATFLTKDPEGPFSQFTALPLVIYRLTTLPRDEFRNAAAAAIIVLLVLLLTLNAIAIILRNRFSRRLT